MQVKISVVVPIYNTGKILRKTLRRIQNQTLRNFECLLINDGSTDTLTMEILAGFSDDPRFRLYHKPNEGIEKTRMYGVERAAAKHIVFCDHDDYYEKNALEVLYAAFLKSNADIIVAGCRCQRFFFSNIGRKVLKPTISEECVVGHDDFIYKYYVNFFGINIFPVSTWGKLYAKSLFDDGLHCLNVNFIEDVIINMQLFEKAKSVHFIPEIIYSHIYGGLSSKFNFNQVINGYDEVYAFRKSHLTKHHLRGVSLLQEYKNVFNQNVNLLIDHNASYDIFERYMKLTQSKGIMMDVFRDLAEAQQGDYIPFLAKNDYQAIYQLARKKNSLGRRVKHVLKSMVRKI